MKKFFLCFSVKRNTQKRQANILALSKQTSKYSRYLLFIYRWDLKDEQQSEKSNRRNRLLSILLNWHQKYVLKGISKVSFEKWRNHYLNSLDSNLLVFLFTTLKQTGFSVIQITYLKERNKPNKINSMNLLLLKLKTATNYQNHNIKGKEKEPTKSKKKPKTKNQ